MISFSAAAVLGILSDRAASLTLAGWLIFCGLVAMLATTILTGPKRRIRKPWLAVLAVVMIAGWAHSRSEQKRYDSASIRQRISDDNQPILVRAKVRSDIQRRPSRNTINQNNRIGAGSLVEAPGWQSFFIADVESVRVGAQWHSCRGGVYVTVDDDLDLLAPGDMVQIGGDIVRFQAPSNPGESDFRLVARNRNLHGRLFVDSMSQITIIDEGWFGVRRFANSLAKSGETTLQKSLGEHTGPLAMALVVGRRGSLDQQMKDRLLETGTIHLLSVSGLHLGIVATAVMSVGFVVGLERRWLVFTVGLGCFLFAAMTGGNPPVIRAGILVATMLTALLVNRRQWPLNTLAFAALILIWLNPTHVEQIGVQLSFLSVATLVSCARGRDSAVDEMGHFVDPASQIESLVDQNRSAWELRLRRWTRHVRDVGWLSLCVTLTTLPLTWLHFNIVSPVAILANLLLSVPASVALMSGLLAVIAGWIWQPLSIVPGFVCDVVLRLMVWIIDATACVPMGHAWLPSTPSWWVAFYFLVLLGSLAIKHRFNRRRYFVLGSLAWFMIGWVLAVSPNWQKRDGLTAIFVDVGHGTSVLLKMPNGHNYLYDCGSLGNDEFLSYGIEDVLWSEGITELDKVILSHADADHYNSLPGLLARFEVGEVVTPPGFFDAQDPALRVTYQAISDYGVPIRELGNEDRFIDAENYLRILHPPKERIAGSDNANSLVIQIDLLNRSLVLPGDLEPPGTEMVTNLERPIAGGVLMAPHHGSLTAKTESMLDWARPECVVVSGGPRAKNPKVKQLLEVRGSRVYVTSKNGAVKVRFTDETVSTHAYLESPW